MTEATLEMDAAAPSATPEPGPAGASVGRKLRARREALGLSVDDVAAVLKIKPNKVEAIEAERWKDLPIEPYLRGFLRNYAKVLQLRDDELPAPPPPRTQVAPPVLHLSPSFESPLPRQSAGWSWLKGPAFAYLLLIALLLVAAAFWTRTQSFGSLRAQIDSVLRNEKPGAPNLSMPATPATGVAPATRGADSSPAGAGMESPNASNAVAEAESRGVGAGTVGGATAARDANPAPDSVAKPGDTAIVLKFGADSWAKVAQSNGEVLTARLNAADTERTVSGTPPFELIIGNASGVRLQYRGANVDLAPYIRGNVARLTLK